MEIQITVGKLKNSLEEERETWFEKERIAADLWETLTDKEKQAHRERVLKGLQKLIDRVDEWLPVSVVPFGQDYHVDLRFIYTLPQLNVSGT